MLDEAPVASTNCHIFGTYNPGITQNVTNRPATPNNIPNINANPPRIPRANTYSVDKIYNLKLSLSTTVPLYQSADTTP